MVVRVSFESSGRSRRQCCEFDAEAALGRTVCAGVSTRDDVTNGTDVDNDIDTSAKIGLAFCVCLFWWSVV